MTRTLAAEFTGKVCGLTEVVKDGVILYVYFFGLTDLEIRLLKVVELNARSQQIWPSTEPIGDFSDYLEDAAEKRRLWLETIENAVKRDRDLGRLVVS